MQPNGMIFWDWNGTLMDDVDFTHSCLNWMLETHGYPQRYDLAAYRELFGFPIEDYYRCAGFDFARHPYPELAARFMEHYNAGVPGCAVTAHAVDTLQTLARMGWQQAVLSASRRDYLIEQVSARGLQGFFTELLGLADIYGVSKVQLGTDYLRRTGIDPAACVLNCRRCVEFAVKWMYSVDGGLVMPYDDRLASLMDTEDFRAIVDRDLWQRLKYIRQTGNAAAHTGKKITKEQAMLCLENLWYFMDFVACCYGTPYTPGEFDPALLEGQTAAPAPAPVPEVDLAALMAENAAE